MNSRFLLALIAVVAASPAMGESLTSEVKGLLPDQVLANLAAQCADNGTVETMTDRQLVCSKNAGFGAQLLLGTRNGAAPLLRVRFLVLPRPYGASVTVSQSIDTMNAFGGAQSRPMGISGKDLTDVMRIARGYGRNAPFPAPADPLPLTSAPTPTPPPSSEGPR